MSLTFLKGLPLSLLAILDYSSVHLILQTTTFNI